MASPKKNDAKPAAKNQKVVKEMSKDDCKKVKGGRASGVTGGLAGSEDFTAP